MSKYWHFQFITFPLFHFCKNGHFSACLLYKYFLPLLFYFFSFYSFTFLHWHVFTFSVLSLILKSTFSKTKMIVNSHFRSQKNMAKFAARVHRLRFDMFAMCSSVTTFATNADRENQYLCVEKRFRVNFSFGRVRFGRADWDTCFHLMPRKPTL